MKTVTRFNAFIVGVSGRGSVIESSGPPLRQLSVVILFEGLAGRSPSCASAPLNRVATPRSATARASSSRNVASLGGGPIAASPGVASRLRDRDPVVQRVRPLLK